MPRRYRYQVEDDIECPDCGGAVEVRLEICPHCETLLR
jgi:hypothetical protein